MPSIFTCAQPPLVPSQKPPSPSIPESDRGVPGDSRTPPSSPSDWAERWDAEVKRIRSDATYYDIISHYKITSTPPVPPLPSPVVKQPSSTFDFDFPEVSTSKCPVASLVEAKKVNRSSDATDNIRGTLLSLSHHRYVSTSLQRQQEVTASTQEAVEARAIGETAKSSSAATARSPGQVFRQQAPVPPSGYMDTRSRPAKPLPSFPPVRKDSLPTFQTACISNHPATSRKPLPVPLSPITGVPSLPPSTPPSVRGSCRSLDPLLSAPEIATPTAAARFVLHRLQEPISEFEDYEDEDEKGGFVTYLKRPLRTSKSQLLGACKTERKARRRRTGFKRMVLTILSCGCVSEMIVS